MQVASTFERAGLPHAFCGGVALAIHGYPRATKDIDILNQASDLDLARHLLLELGYDLEAGILPFELGTEKER